MNHRPAIGSDGAPVYDPMVAQPEAAPALRPRASFGVVLTGAVVAVVVGAGGRRRATPWSRPPPPPATARAGG